MVFTWISIPDNPEHCHTLNVVSGQAIDNTHIKNLAVEKYFYRFSDDFSGIEPQVSQFDGINEPYIFRNCFRT